ncbi:MAG: hypothetical protein AAF225_09100 [Pseudomonadota bacterium]
MINLWPKKLGFGHLLRGLAALASSLLVACATSPVPVDQLPDVGGGSLFVGVPDWCQVMDTETLLAACEGVSIRVAGSQAAAREEALEKAYTSIARKLEANVTSVQTVRQRMETLGARTSISRSVIEEAIIEVEGVPITGLQETNSAVGDVASYYYVRVELDRVAAEDEILGKIAVTDAEIDAYQSFVALPNRLERAKALYPVIALAARRDSLDRELALVGVTTKRLSMAARTADVRRRAIASIDDLRFVLEPSDRGSLTIGTDLAIALRERAGLNIQRAGGLADVTIVYAVRESFRYEESARIFSASADISGSLRDASGRVLTGFNHEAKGFGGSRIDARRSYQTELAEAVADDVLSVLLRP